MTTLNVFFGGGEATYYFNRTNERFANHKVWVDTLPSRVTLPYRNIINSINYSGETIIIGGPGCFNPETDDYIRNHFQWSEAQLISKWNENIEHVIGEMKFGLAFNSDLLPESLSRDKFLELVEVGISLDWLARNFKIDMLNPSETDLYWQRELSDIPSKVNLFGWSRGGISCHMLANAMLNDDVLKDIPIDIFAIDPVVGDLSLQNTQIKISSNVKNYIAFYARDERRPAYACVVPCTHKETKVHIYPIAGSHRVLGSNPTVKAVDEYEEDITLETECREVMNRGYTEYGVPPGHRSLETDYEEDMHEWAAYELNRIAKKKFVYKQTSYDKEQLNKFWEPSELILILAQEYLSEYEISEETKDKLTVKLAKIKSDYEHYLSMRDISNPANTHISGEREILLDGEYTNFTAARGSRFKPEIGLAKGHILDPAYFNDIFDEDTSS
jgi:hypothetical protein